jgi:hypothetical protein
VLVGRLAEPADQLLLQLQELVPVLHVVQAPALGGVAMRRLLNAQNPADLGHQFQATI